MIKLDEAKVIFCGNRYFSVAMIDLENYRKKYDPVPLFFVSADTIFIAEKKVDACPSFVARSFV